MILTIFLYTLDSQPNGNKMENCLTTFKQNNDEEPMWFDRPCNESDGTSDVTNKPGHRFMCECNVSDEQNNISGKIFPTFHLIREAKGFMYLYFFHFSSKNNGTTTTICIQWC